VPTVYSYTDPATGVQIFDCEHCIDGKMPGRLDPVLGSYFRVCQYCESGIPCPRCGSEGVEVDVCCVPHLAQRLYVEHGLRTVYCPVCSDVLRLIDSRGRKVWP
jgi:hypothetical protein